MNNVQLSGRTGKDVELRYSQAGNPFGSISLAVDAGYTDNQGQKVDKTLWFEITVFGRTAENAAKYLGKGSKIIVEGANDIQEWQDRETGQKRSKYVVKAHRIEFLETKNPDGGGNGNSNDGYEGNQTGYNNQNGGQQGQNQQSRPPQGQSQNQNRQPNQGNGNWNPQGQQTQSQNYGNQGYSQQGYNQSYGPGEDLGPAFPSEASGMDDVPF